MDMLVAEPTTGLARSTATPSPGPRGWRRQAACRDEDPELFFPPGRGDTAYAQVEAAKRICLGCPVREPCLTYALATRQREGIWGGLTGLERDQLLRDDGGRATGDSG